MWESAPLAGDIGIGQIATDPKSENDPTNVATRYCMPAELSLGLNARAGLKATDAKSFRARAPRHVLRHLVTKPDASVIPGFPFCLPGFE